MIVVFNSFESSHCAEQSCKFSFFLNALISEKYGQLVIHQIRRFRQLVRRPMPFVLNGLLVGGCAWDMRNYAFDARNL
ncbi:hypothetical protein L596_023504 [Steinernema carpocapsae]|uniref:Uncharacterized protein n=1 Tax=Steinernema carpocapsae TaxID=34508 RepID=A0A4U5MEL6_STECR|nr:hypothetical protein L596_023504 [Steinernema carpocapsae]